MAKIFLTGGSGFLGRALLKKLKADGHVVSAPSHNNFNLLHDKFHPALELCDVVIHAAARVGGIQANMNTPIDFFEENMQMGLNLFKSCSYFRVHKVIFISTTCAYPAFPPRIPFNVDDLWTGFPEPTNAPYGIAKKTLSLLGELYDRAGLFKFITLIPTNLYGPGDNFDPVTSHVIPAIIRKVVDAKNKGERSITLWGHGTATRDFLYVDDCAEYIAKVVDGYKETRPLNIGSGREISIARIASAICSVIGYSGEIIWDATRPDGQQRRVLDMSESPFGPAHKTDLMEGLRRTVEYFSLEVPE